MKTLELENTRQVATFQNRNCFSGKPNWIQHVIAQDRLEQIILIVRFKRWLTGHHFVHQYTKCPPVDRGPVIELLQNLRRNVIRCTAKRRREVVSVGQLAVTFRIKQYIVQLQITVYDTVPVEKLQRERYLGGVEGCPGLIEFAGTLYLEHQITPVHVLHHEEQPVGRLEARVKRGQERMFGGQRQYAFLRHRAIHVVVLQDHVLFQHLDGVHLVRAFLFRQHHLAERTLAQHFDEVEVVQAHLARHWSCIAIVVGAEVHQHSHCRSAGF
uniref:Uncharacterized protein n=1 Tax=Anopheles culicifacies TaxID=139723 RepID=A0A182MDE0_9DIPT